MRRTISLLVHGRPDYTRAVLEGLGLCTGIGRYSLVAYSHLPSREDVIDVVRAHARFCETRLVVEPLPGDVSDSDPSAAIAASVRRLFDLAFADLGSTFHVHLEDDTVPAADALEYFEWAGERYAADPDVFTVSGYARATAAVPPADHRRVERRRQFTVWGWATWKDRWEAMRQRWPHRDFDVHLDRALRAERCEIAPVLGRIQNIGAEGGANVRDPRWHREYHWAPHWAGNTTIAEGTPWYE